MNPDQITIEIQLSKGKILLTIIGSIAFVCGGIWMWNLTSGAQDPGSIFYKIVGVVSVLFFGSTGIYGLLKLFDFKPGLVINKDGLLDNSSALSGQLIKWIDITGFEIGNVQKTRFLLIYVSNPDYYVNQASRYKQKWMNASQKMFGTPLSISSTALKCNFDELVEMIRIYPKPDVNIP
ncbi:MAG: hypothetical protein GC181_07495 [Bacteroidetes bacterium]|nr:hypothetical protein [Bacteroidota bacterium]